MSDKEGLGLSLDDGMLVFAPLNLRFSLSAVCLFGFSFVSSGFTFCLISSDFGKAVTLFGITIHSRYVLVGASIVALLLLCAAYRNKTAGGKAIAVIVAFCLACAVVAPALFLLMEFEMAAFLLLGLTFGSELFAWLHVFYFLHYYAGQKSYAFFSQCLALMGVLLLVLFLMLPNYAVATVGVYCIIAASSCLLVLRCFYQERDDCGDIEYASDGFSSHGHYISFKSCSVLFAYSCVIGLSAGYSFMDRTGFAELAPIFFSICVLGFGVALYALDACGHVRRFMEESVHFVVLVVSAIALALNVFYGSWCCSVVLTFGLGLGYTMVFLRLGYCLKVADPKNTRYYQSFGPIILVFLIGVFCGLVLVLTLFSFEETRVTGGVVLAGISVVVGTLSVGRGGYNLQADFIRNEEDHSSLENLQNKAYERVCESIVQDFGLTERQAEVMLYLGKGKNARYIQEKLTISEHTAKSHIYAIFGKMGIHSQRELLDIVEERCSKEREE